MAASSKQKWTVVTAQGAEVEVVATHVVQDKDHAEVSFLDGDEMVASFRGYSGFHRA